MTGITLRELARIIGADDEDIQGDSEKILSRAMPFEQAEEDAVTFAENPGTAAQIDKCRAGAVIVAERLRKEAAGARANLVFSSNPRLAFARSMHYFYPRRSPFSGISPMARIGENFMCGENVSVAPLAFIGDNVVVGDRTVIYPHVCIENGVKIGDDTEIMANVYISGRCVIGDRVIINPGTVIGSEGFGFTPDQGRHFKIPQVGAVRIEDDAEIGACNTIDRATFGETRIGAGVKTDNQVHIAHNVTIGEHSLVVAQVGVAGSTKVGRNVILAGQAGIGGHISIGDGSVIGPQAGVARDVEPGSTVSGTPEMPHSRWLRVQRIVAGLPEMSRKIKILEKRLAELEKASAADGDNRENDTPDSNN